MTPPNPSRNRRWIIWVVIIGGVLGLGFFVVIGLALTFMSSPEVKRGSVLVIRFEGDIEEAPPESPLSFLSGSGGGAFVSLHELRRLVEAAAKDDRLAGVLLEIGPIGSGFASIEEARGLINRLREAKKPVQAILVADFVEEKDYLLATAADRITMAPESGLLLNGLEAEVTFFRGTLDKLHVEPQFFQFKEYKSAAEPFINHEMSKPMREWVNSMLNDFYGRFLQEVAERRGIAVDSLRTLFDRGGLTAREGLDERLVDALGYSEDIETSMRQAAGVDTSKSGRVLARRYLSAAEEPPAGESFAIIYGIGAITSSAKSNANPLTEGGIVGPRLAKTIRDAAEDSAIKAIILRVNSPGGSAVGSDVVWRAIQDARKRKPVVVSMGDVAGSGGYWISMGADAIVAQPSTITGSIGVVFGKFNVRGLFAWAGVNVDTAKVGANADLMSFFRSLDSHQAQLVKTWMSAVYNDFVRRVGEGRGMSFETVEPLAHGRVWTGAQAKERKLVDELGGVDAAVALAKQKAKLPPDARVRLRRFPQRKGLLELLSEGEFPMVQLLLGPSTVERLLSQAASEWETLRPWTIAPEIRIH
jgi:protease-4